MYTSFLLQRCTLLTSEINSLLHARTKSDLLLDGWIGFYGILKHSSSGYIMPEIV